MLFTHVIFNTYKQYIVGYCIGKITSGVSAFKKNSNFLINRKHFPFLPQYLRILKAPKKQIIKRKIRCMNQSQKGMTFIEVLIALFIIVSGILGAVAMQATAKKGSFDAMQRSLASALAQDIVERMRNNDATTLALYAASSPYGSGKITNPPTCNSSAALCTPAQMVTHDLFGWEQAIMGGNVTNEANNVGGLLDAVGCISQENNAVTVVISWQGREDIADAKKVDGCGSGAGKRRQVAVEAFIY